MRWNMTHRGEDFPSIQPARCCPVPHRWQASRRITLPQPVNSPVVLGFVCADKGTWVGCGRPVWFGLHSERWAGSSSCCCCKEGRGFTCSSHKVGTFPWSKVSLYTFFLLLFIVILSLTFAVYVLWSLSCSGWHSYRAVKFVLLFMHDQ